MFGPEVVVKYDVTQRESCLSISPIPLFALNLDGNALRVYARVTVVAMVPFGHWAKSHALHCII